MTADREPSGGELKQLQARLLSRDPTGGEALCRAVLGPLEAYLRSKFPRTDPDLLAGAAADAALEHLKDPARHDGSQRGLMEYLRVIAWRRAANAVRGADRQRRNEVPLEAAEDAGEIFVAADPVAGKMVSEGVEAYVALLIDEKDRAFVRLLAAGVKDVTRLGAALGLSGTEAELKLGVKRARDRVRKWMRRKGVRL